MDLRSIFREIAAAAIRRRRFVRIVAISFFLGAIAYAQSLPDVYEETTTISLLPRPTIRIEGDDAVKLGLPRYISLLSSPATAETVARSVGTDADEIEHEIQIGFEEESATVEITARDNDPELATAIANELAAEALSFSRDDEVVRVEITAPAILDHAPEGPPRGRLGLAALAVGGLIGIAGAIVFERYSPHLRDRKDVIAITHRPLLGQVPNARIVRTTPGAAFNHPGIGAALRTLRTTLDRHVPPGSRVIAVAGADAGQGASAVTALLAEALARGGRRTLIVDADLRRPSLARRFGLDQERSLSGALRGAVSFEEAIKKGWVEGLSALTTKIDLEGADLIATEFGQILEEARDRFDEVIVDSPPLLTAPEASSIAHLADGLLIVARAGSHIDPLREAMAKADDLRTPFIAVVVNAIQSYEAEEFAHV